MRVTEGMRYGVTERALADLRSRQAAVTEEVSSGRRVGDPSDDPVAASELTRLAGRLARTEDYQRTIGRVRADLSLSERTLDSASALMVRAQELAIQGANGSLSADDRRMLAEEVSALQLQLRSFANTRGTRGYLFSGNLTETPSFSETGVYQGDAAVHRVDVAPGVELGVTVSGDEAFGPAGGADAFQALESLHAALQAGGEDQVAASLEGLEAARAQIVGVQAEAGLILNRLDSSEEALGRSQLEMQKRSSELGDTDPFAALSELTSLTTTLEQAIAVARTTLSSGRFWLE